MPDAAVLDAPTDVEPTDKRTKEWKEWAARQPGAAIPKMAAPRVVKIMPPDEFAAAYFVQNAGAISARSGEPNPIQAMAEVCWKAYRAYLITVSDAFFDHTKANDMDTTTQFISKPKVWPAYDIATGAAK